MNSSCLARAEAIGFRALNSMVEPWVRAGVGSPWLWPTGVILLETTGRRTGRTLSVPVLATLVGDLAVVSTIRPGSQWMRNLAARPDVHYWVHGRRQPATAEVVTPEAPGPSPSADVLRCALAQWSRLLGMSFAILSPRPAA